MTIEEALASEGTDLFKDFYPLLKRGVVLERSVVGLGDTPELDMLYPATRLEGPTIWLLVEAWVLKRENLLEGLLVQLNPVGDTASHGSDVNKVKAVVWECPFLVDIVNLEFAVWRNKARLDG